MSQWHCWALYKQAFSFWLTRRPGNVKNNLYQKKEKHFCVLWFNKHLGKLTRTVAYVMRVQSHIVFNI